MSPQKNPHENPQKNSDENETPGYPMIRIALHWATVLSVVGAAGLGLWISDLGDDPLRVWGSRAHFFLGLFTGLLFVGRLVAWARMKPVAPLSLGEGHRRFMKAIHIGLYAVGLAMVGAGMATSITSGWPAYLSGEIAAAPNFTGLREVHEILVFTFFGLVLLHVVGVLNHERVHGGTLRRMLSVSTR